MAKYQITALWWPDGWEPHGPLDVPNCVAIAPEGAAAEPETDLEHAWATVRGLNRQNMDHPGKVWYVVNEIAGQPVGACSSCGCQSEGGAELRILRAAGSTTGDCSHCPASSFPCATEKQG